MLTSSPTIPEVVFERIKSDITELSFNFFQDGVSLDVATKSYKIRLKASGIQALEKTPATNAAGRVTFVLSNADKTPLNGSEYQISLVELITGGERTIVTGTLRWSVPSGKTIGLVVAPDVSVNYIAATGSLMVALGVVDFGSSSSALSAAAAAQSATLAGNEAGVAEDHADAAIGAKNAVDIIAGQVSSQLELATAAATSARDSKLAAQSAASLAQAAYNEKGDWNAATNIPALTADATIGSNWVPGVSGKPQRYVITVPGILTFAIKGYAAGASLPVGYLMQHPSGQWYYSPIDSTAIVKTNEISASIGATTTTDYIGSSLSAGTGESSNVLRCYINIDSCTINGIADSLYIKTLAAGGGDFDLVQFRPNSTTLLEVSKYRLTAAVGVNNLALGNLGIAVLAGDTFGIAPVAPTKLSYSQNVAGAHYIFASLNGQGKWEVVKDNYPGLPSSPNLTAIQFQVAVKRSDLKNVDAQLVAANAAINTNIADISTLKQATLHVDPNYVLTYNIPNQGGTFWGDSTFRSFAFGYLPTEYTQLAKIECNLNQVNGNDKLTLQIFRRPVANASSLFYPGASYDVLLYTIDYAKSNFADVATFQNVLLQFPTIPATTDYIYLFSIKATKTGGGTNSLGSDRLANSTAMPQYERGWYNDNGALPASGQMVRRVYKEVIVPNKVQDAQQAINVMSVDVNNLKTSVPIAQSDIEALKFRNLHTRPGTKLFSDRLTTISADYTNNGWLGVTGGISPSTNGLAGFLQLNKQYALQDRKARCYVKFGSNSRFLFFTRHSETDGSGTVSLSNRATITECDVLAGKIRLYKAYNNSTSALPAVNSEISFPFVSGREYLLELTKGLGFVNSFKVVDTVTGVSATITESLKDSGRQCDSYCFANYSGAAPILRQLTVSKPFGDTLYLIGDSITEGFLITLQSNGFSQKAVTAVGGNGAISGRGVGTILGALARIETEMAFIKPKYVIITIGTNGGNTVANLRQICNRVIELGSIPILNNIPIRADGNSIHLTANPLIEQVRGELGLSGCKFDVALALNNDVTQGYNTALYQADMVHPNEDGFQMMLNMLIANCPEIFE